MRSRLSFLGLMMMLISLSLPLQAQEAGTPAPRTPPRTDAPLPAFPNNCAALPLVGGEGSQVTKEISPPAVNVPIGPASIGTHNNWHTDWYISSDHAYKSFKVMLMIHSDREYDIAMYLKYPDNKKQRFYREQRVNLKANQLITVDATPNRSDLEPYQVNTNIGGIQAVGARYTVAVAGCR
ncbi:MAG TPA: hypothetical protein V6C57_28175 [Coleofasciculaceae cyanobacterium]